MKKNQPNKNVAKVRCFRLYDDLYARLKRRAKAQNSALSPLVIGDITAGCDRAERKAKKPR